MYLPHSLQSCYYVYIISNVNNTVLYIGITNDLCRRLMEHRGGLKDGFTKKYQVHKLVYGESIKDVRDAIAREKQLKKWRRDKKDALIEINNPTWRDLSQEIDVPIL